MSKLSHWYVNASETKRNLFWLGCLCLLGFVLLSAFFFLGNPGVPLGYLAGSLVGIGCYLLIVYGANNLVSEGEGAKVKGVALTILLSALRFLLLLGLLALSALATFRYRNNLLNFWAVGGGYLPMVGVVALGAILSDRRKKKRPSNEPKQEEKP